MLNAPPARERRGRRHLGLLLDLLTLEEVATKDEVAQRGALGLGGEAPIVSPGALVGFAGERIFALRDAAKAAKGPRRRESAH